MPKSEKLLPQVEESDVGYSDSKNITCVRPESVLYVTEFMKFISSKCRLEELEDA
jgi:hypothetical protein